MTNNSGGKTGWPPGLLQDDDKKLSQWLANRLGARRIVKHVCAEIQRTKKEQLA